LPQNGEQTTNIRDAFAAAAVPTARVGLHDRSASGPAHMTALIRLFSSSASSSGDFHAKVFRCLTSNCSLSFSSAQHVEMTVSPSPNATAGGTSLRFVEMFEPRAAMMVDVLIRNTVPVPLAPMILPMNAVPAPPPASGHKIDERYRVNRCLARRRFWQRHPFLVRQVGNEVQRLGRERGRLCRCRQS
jgi:hypothetical protein